MNTQTGGTVNGARGAAAFLLADGEAMLRAERNLGIVHADGIAWYDARIPRRWHRCKPQTTSREIERCACGALRFVSGPGSGLWGERNSRKRRA